MSSVAFEAPVGSDFRASLWWFASLAFLVTIMPMGAMGFRADPSRLNTLVALILATGVFNLVRHRIASEALRRLFDTFEMLGLCSLLCLLACVATYGVAVGTTGMADPLLARADLALGFDWRTAHSAVEGSPALQLILRTSYNLIFMLPVLAIIGLGATGNGRKGRRFVLAYGIALMLSLITFAWFPAGGPMGHFAIGLDRYQPITNDEQRVVIELLRAGHLRTIDISELHALVSFPSVHAASAILFTWAMRSLKLFFWPMAIANGLMLLATPVEGNHYLVDVIAGVAIAGLAIAASGWVALRHTPAGEELHSLTLSTST